jgi:predicted nucleic acid-binding protein
MSGSNIVLDTNICPYLLSGEAPIVEYLRDKSFYISIINEIEILGFRDISKSEQTAISFFLEDCNILDINKGIKDISISLRKRYMIKLPDAIIAATAIFLNIPLISADKVFDKITELNVVLYEP